MNYWGLTQGIIGRARASLAPSSTALGPNVYLNERDFLKMLGVAFAAHALVFGIAALVPREKVTNIPVRALSFKLGDMDRVAAYAPAPVVAPVVAPVAPPVMKAEVRETWRPSPHVPAPVTPEPLKPVAREQPKPAPKPVPVKQPKVYKVEELMPLPQAPAIAPNPQQYVREVGAPSQQAVAAAVGTPDGAVGGQGAQTILTQQTVQAIRTRYEQDISGWIQRHKYYPAAAGGHEGRAIVRMRIDRAGNVRYYAIEQSAGNAVLDAAAIDMVRRANPVPAVPAEYPAGNLVEFLIPITFKAP